MSIRPLVLGLVFAVVLLGGAWSGGAEEGRVTGVVRDASGGVVAGAHVSLLTSEQSVVDVKRTDEQGRFAFPTVRPGTYLLVVNAPGFAEVRMAASPGEGGESGISVTVEPEGVRATVSVTASRGTVQDVAATAQPVNVIDAEQILLRSRSVVAQAVAEETGIHLLRTSPTVAGIYVRGLTGNKVNIFVDGVRYSTSAQRGGINTFLDLIEPTTLQGIEVLRGPNSSQYGSDALGGSVQFLSQTPSFSSGAGRGVHGLFSAKGGTADSSAGMNLSLGYGGGKFGVYANVAARNVNDLRPGEGIDSHAAVTRFLGVTSDRLMSEHLPDTGFTQYGGLLRINWAPTANQQVMLYYNRSQQPDGKRYDQLLGGDGNLVADLRDLSMDLFYVKYQRFGVGWFDQLTATYSFNSQYEERVNQGGNGNPKASITHEPERTNAHGLQAQLTKRLAGRHDLLVGGEFYPERIDAPSSAYNPVNGAVTVRRGRVPDNASYKSGAVYAGDVFEAVPDRLQVMLNARFSWAAYESLAADSPIVSGKPLWPDDSLSVSNGTFRAGVSYKTGLEGLSITANIARGFRAPHVTDLGTVGLTGSGYQVSATEVQGRDAMVGSTAGASAVSTGIPVEQVGPETSLSYEAGFHYRTKKVSTDFFAFINDVYDNITYQALILPPGAVGTPLGDQVINAQNSNGVVYVPASSSPVLVRTNFGDARIYGFEHSLEWRVTRSWTVNTVFTYLHAADKSTGQPPNIEGGTPAPDGYLKVRYLAPSGRWWAEPYLHLAAQQNRLSTLDLEDRRTGATRTRTNIRNFFYNGATARGWVSPGADGVAGNGDDLLTTTGETLAQVQSRVLGTADSAPLYTFVRGYTTLGIRGGVKVGTRHELIADFENVSDVNYRGIAWGVDAPGRNLTVSWRTKF
jgi:hemoglobin/transferrin/lactoferrin receptor protein